MIGDEAWGSVIGLMGIDLIPINADNTYWSSSKVKRAVEVAKRKFSESIGAYSEKSVAGLEIVNVAIDKSNYSNNKLARELQTVYQNIFRQ